MHNHRRELDYCKIFQKILKNEKKILENEKVESLKKAIKNDFFKFLRNTLKVIQTQITKEEEKVEILKEILLLKNNSQSSLVHIAIDEEEFKTLKQIYKSVNLNSFLLKDILLAKDKYGQTPLHTAIQFGYIKVTQVILSAVRGDTKLLKDILLAKDKYGQTPLHTAIQFGYIKVTQVILSAVRGDTKLLNEMISITSEKSSETNALNFAFKKDNPAIVKCILNIFDPREAYRLISKKNKIEDFKGYNTRELFSKIGGVTSIIFIENQKDIPQNKEYFDKCTFIVKPLNIESTAKNTQDITKQIDEKHQSKIINPSDFLYIYDLILCMKLKFNDYAPSNIDQLNFWQGLMKLPNNESCKDKDNRYNLAGAIIKNDYAKKNKLDSREFSEIINQNINKVENKDILDWAITSGYEIDSEEEKQYSTADLNTSGQKTLSPRQ